MCPRPTDVTAPITDNQTWNTCPQCLREWKSVPAIPSVLHRTILCDTCKEFNKL